MTSKIAFLDIDGVMIPSSMYLIDRQCSLKRLFPPTTIAVMNEICKRSGAKIVLNTSHNRSRVGVPNIIPALIAGGLDKEHFHPTDPMTRYPDINRANAIEDWLARHLEVLDDWVVFDDVVCADAPHMILIDPDTGIHVGHANQALRILDGDQIVILV